MKVLVTGGLGVNGSWVTRELIERGHVPVVLETRDDTSLLPDLAGKFPIVIGDIMDLDGMTTILRDHEIDAIVHLAALMPPRCQSDLRLGFDVNALGAVNVFEAAKLAGVKRVVFTSSKSAYGRVPVGPHTYPTYEPISEDHTCDPVIAYDVGKLAAEGMAANYRREHGLEIASLRFGTILAPGKLARHGEVALLSRILENALAGERTVIERGGDEVDDIMFVADVVAGIVAALEAPKVPSPVYNIATGIGTSLYEFADAVRRAVPGAQIEIGPGLDYYGYDVTYYTVSDITRARTELGYEPAYGIDDAIGAYIDAARRLRATESIATI
ncbi:NAD-dependent epimerase/dehydratase family protein [Microbacterium atlanticum]|uniref:NAD-dependent epimerase/dehydratase family protein n=1 Tax=Microbacterium atlanticum TaxID=2782168 RepID=UPI0018897FB1|nr:NAD-dependent epimerase/dehydratase family protein [Microbacterium atlanticum]